MLVHQHCFFTFLSADKHWPELHALLSTNTDTGDIASKTRLQNVINNPHIADCSYPKIRKLCETPAL